MDDGETFGAAAAATVGDVIAEETRIVKGAPVAVDDATSTPF